MNCRMLAKIVALVSVGALGAQASPQERGAFWPIGAHEHGDRAAGHRGFVLAQFQGPGPQHGPSEEEKARIRERIGISRQQQQAIEQLFESSGRQMRELRDRYRDLTRKLNDEVYAHYDFDRPTAKSLRKEIMGLHWK